MTEIITYRHPDVWRNSYAWSRDDIERLRRLCLRLLAERENILARARKMGFEFFPLVVPDSTDD
jgi:hypothetical protein